MSFIYEDWKEEYEKSVGIPFGLEGTISENTEIYEDWRNQLEEKNELKEVGKEIVDKYDDIKNVRVFGALGWFKIIPEKRFRDKRPRQGFTYKDIRDIVEKIKSIDPSAETMEKTGDQIGFYQNYHVGGTYNVALDGFGTCKLDSIDEENFKQFLDAFAPEYGIEVD